MRGAAFLLGSTLRRQFLGLTCEQIGLMLCVFLAALEFGVQGGVINRLGLFRRFRSVRRLFALDEHPLLAHFHMDGACLAAGIGLLDFAGLLARQGDFLAIARRGPVRCAQVIEQAGFVSLADGSVHGPLSHARLLELLQHLGSGFTEFCGELCDGITGH
ncbi:hypothetical protein GALL_433600 [mine drainage metagenome]|uniref:Uncharacterized protein n=1 Tax=mine drainage metagenome TaxID=410659 RepID=A0A1J5QBX0_9ZZZZ